MSEQQTFGQEAVESHQNFEAMVPANPVPKDEPQGDVFGGDYAGIQDAADELFKLREAAPETPSEVVREYKQNDPDGQKKMAENKTVSAEQAAFDLSNMRELEGHIDQTALEAEIRAEIDQLRGDQAQQTQPQQQPTPTEPIALDQQQQRDLAELQRWQAMSEQERSQAWESLPYEQREVLLDKAARAAQQADTDIARALQENPQLISAVEQEVQRRSAPAEQARAQYEAGLIQNGQLVAASIAARYGELQGVATDQWGTVLQTLSRSGQAGQARAAQILGELHATRHILAQGAQAETAQRQRTYAAYQQHQANVQAQFQQEATRADAAFEKWAASQDIPERVNEVRAMAQQLIAEEGYSPEQISYLWNSPYLRSITAQKQLYRAASYELARRTAKSKVSRPVPNVVRPGSPAERIPDSDHYLKKLERPGEALSPKQAAEYVVARRAARRQ